ncbi:MAG: VOC family protein [Pseudomonadota bacterium]
MSTSTLTERGSGALGSPAQLAYEVNDVATAAAHWARHYGAGPFYVLEHVPLAMAECDGAPVPFDHSSAYGWHGHIMIELLQLHGEPPPPFRGGGPRLHHVAYRVPVLDTAISTLSAAGHDLALRAQTAPGGNSEGTTFVFMDARSTHGHFIELYEDGSRLRAFYEFVEQAANRWDGFSDPVRAL